MSDLAISVLKCFEDESDYWSLMEMTHYRTFLLFVAEELSPSLPVQEVERAMWMLERAAAKSMTLREYADAIKHIDVLRDLVRGM